MNQNCRVWNLSEYRLQLAPDRLVRVVAIKKKEGTRSQSCSAKNLHRNVKAISLVELYFRETLYQLPPAPAWVLNMAYLVRKVDRMDLRSNTKPAVCLVEDSRRFPNIRPPFEEVGRLKPAHGRYHQHLFVERKRGHTHNRNQNVEDETGDRHLIDLELGTPGIYGRVGIREQIFYPPPHVSSPPGAGSDKDFHNQP